MINRNHIIQKQFIELSFESVEEAMGMQNLVAEVFYSKLLPRMETLSNEMIGEHYIVQLEKLEIDCGILGHKNWEDEWVEQTIRQMKLRLLHANKRKIKSIGPNEIADEEFLFFIEHGHFSWKSRYQSLKELESSIFFQKQLITRVRTLIAASPLIAKRIINQFSKKFRKKLISAISEAIPNGKVEYNSITQLLPPDLIEEKTIDICLLQALSINDETPVGERFFRILYREAEETIKPLIEKMVPSINLQKLSIKQEVKKSSTERVKEEIYINNAGLVLLHPFLPAFFEQLELTNEDHWRNEQDRVKALRLTQFLVTGKDEYAEYELPLNKILCGVKIQEPIITDEVLTNELKSACDALLDEVINHWVILKNTGVEALRETFLQRKGSLKNIDHGWLLQVEQKGVDVLLSNLPWGIATIKLPWMQEMIFVEWA